MPISNTPQDQMPITVRPVCATAAALPCHANQHRPARATGPASGPDARL